MDILDMMHITYCKSFRNATPCIKVVDEVDMTFQNNAALVNTELLKAYSKMCVQLRDLGIAVKRWAKVAAGPFRSPR